MNKRAEVHILIIFTAALLLFWSACKEDKNVEPVSKPFIANRPSHFPEPYYQYGDNVFTKEGFELGRKLFHDPILSINNTISCASCHKQEAAFADAGVVISPGVNGGKVKRNAPPLFNLAWNTSFMWDGGVNHLEVSPLAALQHPLEMGETLQDILAKLKNDAEYNRLFGNAFHRDTIDTQQLFWALAQYMSNVVSATSKYDEFIIGKGSLTQAEKTGAAIFNQHCEPCHKEPLFTNYSFQNNGLDSLIIDSGRYRITQVENDIGKFKVPTLRNIELTYPYMHDGRFSTLEEVVEHYSSSIKPSPTLASQLPVGGFQLSDEEKANLVTFLKTLTDKKFVEDTLYQE